MAESSPLSISLRTRSASRRKRRAASCLPKTLSLRLQAVPLTEVVTEPDGTVKHFSCGVLHRDDGPAVIEVYPDYQGFDRHRSWYRFGVLDRDDGPAVIGGATNGQYEWWRAGVRHRDDGPAVIELIDSFEFGNGPVYEWWQNGVRQRVQDADGIIYYFREGETVLTELPDGCRIIARDNEYRCEDPDGNELEDVPCLDAYEGYLENNECAHPIYAEPQATFDTFNPVTAATDVEGAAAGTGGR
jgi:hypothetical protein